MSEIHDIHIYKTVRIQGMQGVALAVVEGVGLDGLYIPTHDLYPPPPNSIQLYCTNSSSGVSVQNRTNYAVIVIVKWISLLLG